MEEWCSIHLVAGRLIVQQEVTQEAISWLENLDRKRFLEIWINYLCRNHQTRVQYQVDVHEHQMMQFLENPCQVSYVFGQGLTQPDKPILKKGHNKVKQNINSKNLRKNAEWKLWIWSALSGTDKTTCIRKRNARQKRWGTENINFEYFFNEKTIVVQGRNENKTTYH